MKTSTLPVIFYTYTGIVGHSILPVDIGTYYISVVIAYFVTALLQKKRCLHSVPASVALIGLAVIAVLFFVFTYYPPALELFRNPKA